MFKCHIPNENLSNEDIKLLIAKLKLCKGDSLNWEKTLSSQGVANFKYQVVRMKSVEAATSTDLAKKQPTPTKQSLGRGNHEKKQSITKSQATEKRRVRDPPKKKAAVRRKNQEETNSALDEATLVSNRRKFGRKRSSSSDRSGFLKNLTRSGKAMETRRPINKPATGRRMKSTDSDSEFEAETEETSSNDLYRVVESRLDSMHEIFGVDQTILVKRWLELGDFDLLIREVHKEKIDSGTKIVLEFAN